MNGCRFQLSSYLRVISLDPIRHKPIKEWRYHILMDPKGEERGSGASEALTRCASAAVVACGAAQAAWCISE